MTEVLVPAARGKEPRHPRPGPDKAQGAWKVVAGAGVAISLVGWTDLVLLWFPLHVGTAQWEFGTISAHLDGMPLGTVGLAALAACALAVGKPVIARALAVMALLVAFWVLAISILFVLDVPVVLRAAAPPMRPMLVKAIIKAGVFAPTYFAFYSWLAGLLWRNARPVKA